MRLRFAFPILLLSLGLFATAQQQTELSSAASEFQISGTLVDADTSQPLAHARVAIASVTARDDMRVIVTGDDGQFLFAGLSPGKYTLSAQARGHLLQAFNQHDQFSSSIAVGPDLESTNLVFRLPAEGSISGTVGDEAGEPVRDAIVSLYLIGVDEGVDATRVRGRITTSDEGAYRFSHLAPGQYLIGVSARPWYSHYAVSYKDSGDPPPAPGEISIQTARSPLDLAYPLTFSGGSTDVATASVIHLGRGERLSANINLQPVPALHLRILNEEKPGTHGNFISVEERVLGAPPFRVMIENRTVGSVLETGGVAPGHYAISTSSVNGRGDSTTREVDLSSNTNVQVRDDSFSGSVSATLQSDGAGLPKNLLVRLINKKSQQAIGERVDDEGQVLFKQTVLPGSYEVALFNNQGTYLKTLSAEGATLKGRTLEIKAGAAVKLKIGIGHGYGSVSGVALREGKPVAGTMVVLVPPDPAYSHVLFRRDQSDTDGTFTIANVVPGNYTVVAIENGWSLEWMNQAVLSNYLAHGAAVSVQANTKSDVKVPVQ